MNDESVNIWKEAVVAYLNVLFRYLPRGTADISHWNDERIYERVHYFSRSELKMTRIFCYYWILSYQMEKHQFDCELYLFCRVYSSKTRGINTSISSAMPHCVNVVPVTLLAPQGKRSDRVLWSVKVMDSWASVFTAVSLPHWFGNWTPDVVATHSSNHVNPPAPSTVSN